MTGEPINWDIIPVTKPMFVLLVGAAETGQIKRTLYPTGQMRLIMQGLLNRELIDEDGELTPLGREQAGIALAEVRRAHPDKVSG